MIHRLIRGVLTPALLLAPASAMAQVQGQWTLTGQIDGKPVAVDCDFRPQGSTLGGTCTDIAQDDTRKPGKSHTLTQGTVNGTSLRWSYPVKVMIMSIDINFSGTITGERMAGTIEAKGRRGKFSAVKKHS